MALFDWNSTYEINVPGIDAQHQKLVAILNKLHQAMLSGKGQNILEMTFEELVSYTKTHFKSEEALMSRHDYPQYLLHK